MPSRFGGIVLDEPAASKSRFGGIVLDQPKPSRFGGVPIDGPQPLPEIGVGSFGEPTVDMNAYAKLPPAARRQINQKFYRAQQQFDPQVAGYRKELADQGRTDWFHRSTLQAAAGLGATIKAGGQRLLGDSAGANQTENQMDSLRTAVAQENTGWLQRIGTGTVESLTKLGYSAPAGLAGILTMIGGDSYSQNYAEAKRKGMSDEEAAYYGRGNAALEVGITGLFQLVGLGGVEKEILRSGGWKGVQNLLVQTGAELSEEELTGLSQSLLNAPLNPNTDYKQQAVDIAAQTLLTMGLVEGVKSVQGFVENPSRQNAKKLGIEGIVPSKKAREEMSAGLKARYAETIRKMYEAGDVSLENQNSMLAALGQPLTPAASPQQPSPQPLPAASSSTIPSSAAAIVPKSVLQLNAIAGNAASFGTRAKRFLTRNFLSGGEKNEATQSLLYGRDSTIRKNLAELRQNSTALERAVRKDFGLSGVKQIPDTIGQQLDAALKDQSLMSSLPTETALALQKMRDHVDALSQAVANIPGAGAELQLSIQKNLGQYITRTYKKFDNPDGWAQKALADQTIMQGFAAEVRQTSPNATDDEINQLAQILLSRNTTDVADLATFSPRSQSYVNTLKKRKDLSGAVRALYGEKKDAWENYQTTVANMANLVANREFVGQLKARGLQDGFFSPVDQPKPGHIKQVNDQLPQLQELKGVLMEPELASAINDIYTVATPGKGLRFLSGLSGYAKASKTVGSLQATVRNFTGNLPIAIANGAWNPKDLLSSGKLTTIDFLNKGDAATKAELVRLHELGVVEGVNAEALKDIAKDVSASLADYVAGIDSRNHFKRFTRGAANLYQSMDTVWKIHTYKNELRVLQEANPGAPLADLETQAARTVRAITPTYSEASKAAKYWSRYVPLGPFAMFNAEMFRTTGNRLRIAKQELASGNPVLQRQGAKRVAGQLAVFAGGYGAALAAKSLLGLSDDEYEAMRQRLAPWQKNSPIVPTSKDKETGKFEYFDAGYNDPFSVITNPLIALSRGKPGEAAQELAEPFLSEDLAYGAIVSVLRGTDENDRPIYDPGLSPFEQNVQIMGYLMTKLEPGTLTSARRIVSAVKGETSKSGRAFDLGNEVLSVAGGVKKETLDRAQADFFRNREFSQRIKDSEKSIRATFLARGSFAPDSARTLYESAEAKRRQTLQDWRKFVDGSILLGEKNPFQKVVSDVGGASLAVKLMYSKQYRPYVFQMADFRRMAALPDGPARIALFQELAAKQNTPAGSAPRGAQNGSSD